MKRVFEITVAAFALAALAPLLLLIGLVVFLEDRRSPFFRALRVGRGGREFRMLKFRTMVPNAWKSGVNSTASGDSRVTRTGRRLRKAKLDELPQLWNVLTGEMSLVGPRPQIAAEVWRYTTEERCMLDVRPGITDLASIVFADEGEILAGSPYPDLLYNQIIRPWKSRLALTCIEHGSPAADTQTIILTLLSAISLRLARRGVDSMLAGWNADATLRRMASRSEPLRAWPPPGATAIVSGHSQAGSAVLHNCPSAVARAGPQSGGDA